MSNILKAKAFVPLLAAALFFGVAAMAHAYLVITTDEGCSVIITGGDGISHTEDGEWGTVHSMEPAPYGSDHRACITDGGSYMGSPTIGNGTTGSTKTQTRKTTDLNFQNIYKVFGETYPDFAKGFNQAS